MIRFHSRYVFGAAIALMSLTITGCSSSGHPSGNGDGGSATSTPATSAPAISGTPADASKSPIKIGILNAITGTNSSSQGISVLDAAKAWVAWVNQTQGGIDGHPVDLISKDTQAEPAAAAAAANTLVQDGVVALIGSSDGQDEAIYTKPFVDAKIPVIGGAIISDTVMTASPYIFGDGAGAVPGLKLIADIAKKNGAHKLGAILCNNAPTCDGASTVIGGEAQKVGLAYGGYVGISDGAPNYDAECLTLKERGVDYVFPGVQAEIFPRIVADCAQQGYKPHYMDAFTPATALVIDPLVKQYGVDFSGFIPSFPWWGTALPIALYRQVMQQFNPTHEVFEGQGATQAWTSFEIFRKAMMLSGSQDDVITAASVERSLDTIKDDDLGGLLPQKLTFAAGRSSAEPTCGWEFRNSNGTFTDGDVICLTPGG